MFSTQKRRKWLSYVCILLLMSSTAFSMHVLQLVKSLVEKGEDMNGYSAEGFRPLCIAAFWGYSNVVQLLLKHGWVWWMYMYGILTVNLDVADLYINCLDYLSDQMDILDICVSWTVRYERL